MALAIICALLALSPVVATGTRLKGVLQKGGAPLDEATRHDIDSHAAAVRSLVDGVTAQHRHETHRWLCALADQFGNRIATSPQLDAAVEWVANFARQAGLEVHTEETDPLPRWLRGDASAVVTQPMLAGDRQAELTILALGRSVGTPLEGIEAPVAVFRDWDELEQASVNGSIVLLAPEYRGYGNTVQYRTQGATRAAARGAVAVLVRSIAPMTLGLAHTGVGGDAPTPIPAAAISHESADMLARMAARGDHPRVRLHLGAHEEAPVTGRVVVADLPGTDLAHEIVLVSGHLDSWDVGTGALDDGGGVAISLHTLMLLKKLAIQPRRTIRFIAWNGEEFGLGSTRYWREHAHEVGNVTVAFESDEGVFAPTGIQLSGSVEAHATARAVGQLIVKAGGQGAVETGGFGQDVEDALQMGVPVVSLSNEANTWLRHQGVLEPGDARFQGDYFLYHHTVADTPNVLDPDQMDEALKTWASFALVLANLSMPLPRGAIADDAALNTALGSANTRSMPAVCGPDWEPPTIPSGPSGDHANMRGINPMQLALAGIAAALIGAGGAWLFLHPGYVTYTVDVDGDGGQRRAPVATPARHEEERESTEAIGAGERSGCAVGEGELRQPLLGATTTD